MKKALTYILENKFALLISLIVVSGYYYYTLSGNRICNCEKTEQEKRSRVNRFYNSNNYQHK
ncbi:MAG: hypothetical protein O9267_01125 [Flavobacterium sp.]|jgi:hypothetical protein|uniref:hypothetical protein n=1 Tax=Flavobacterium sp. TaxID=239 RepID=UPI0022CBA4ED|nr:hypothetical protein [Flavobacterium sp.]MCZ8196189.1 hypothetical protein [Flavobacterium sp.]